ncbi:hypothetical protein J4441_01860 [Candidatus Micrarchaeota archaeon]|nr:hypothetical protein [Candidatus Micrarchaeota archaeon]
MIGKMVTQPKPVSLAQVEEILSKRSADGDFGYEQQKSFDYAKRFAKVSARKAAELMGQLQEEFGVPYEAAVKIVDVMPKHPAQLRVLLAGTVSEEKQKKMLEVLSKVKIKHVEDGAEAVVQAETPAEEAQVKVEEGEQSQKKKDAQDGEKEGAVETGEVEKKVKKAKKDKEL